MNHNETNDDKDEDKTSTIRLGLKANFNQFLLLVLVNAFVGAMIGLEQTVVPLLGKEEFGLESNVLILSFIASFGIVKALLNLFAGKLSDRWNRKKVLVLGWLFAVPVPFILLYGPSWNWVLFANVLLGVNQGLAWSMTVNMKIDLVGRERRGLALGLNEFAGYVSVALVGFLTGYIAGVYGLEPYPLYLGIAFSLLGLAISVVFVRDTSRFTELELKNDLGSEEEHGRQRSLNFKQIFLETSWKNRSLLAASQAGLVNNLIFGVT